MIPLLLFIGVITWLVYLAYNTQYPKQYNAMKKLNLPGEPQIPIIGTMIDTSSSLAMTKALYAMYEKYGSPVVMKLFNQYTVHIFKAEHVEVVLSSSVNITKGQTYGLIRGWLGNGLLTSTGKEWFSQRKMLTPAFHFKILHGFVRTMNEHSAKFSDILQTRIDEAKNGETTVDLCPLICLCALDIICETSMGKDLNSQGKPRHPYALALNEFSESTITRMLQPWTWNDTFYHTFFSKGRVCKKSQDALHDFTREVIKERRQSIKSEPSLASIEEDEEFTSGKKKLAFLDLLLDMERKRQMTGQDVQEQVDTIMFEGHDTTSHAIMWGMYELARHADHQKLCQDEIDQVLGDDMSYWPTLDDLSKMKHLEYCLKEASRVHAPVPLIERKLVDDAKLEDGIVVPAGVNIGINLYKLHHDAAHFPDPLKFDPYRWTPENSKGRHPFAYVPFSAGPRNCIGQRFALAEEKIMVLHLLRQFTFTCEQTSADMKNNEMICFVLRPMKGVVVTVRPRV